MTRHRFALLILITILLAANTGGAFVLRTSARVEIVPCVRIECLSSQKPHQEGSLLKADIPADDRIVFRVLGPPDQSVNITLTEQGFATSPGELSEEHQHDSEGVFLIRMDEDIERYHLMVEYE